MNVIPLGTNGFFPSFGRQTMCFVIPVDKILILLDAGSGLGRLVEPEGEKLLARSNQVHLYLSHPHLDHTTGFYAAFKLLKGKKVTVFGMSHKQFYSELASTSFFPSQFAKSQKPFQWQEISQGVHLQDSYQVAVRKQKHNGFGSLAYKFTFPDVNKELAYVTDSEPTSKSVKFVASVSLLLHEHYVSGQDLPSSGKKRLEDQFLMGHVTTIGAAMIAKEANVGELVLIHHYPFADGKILRAQLKLAQSIFERTILAKDLEVIRF